MRIAVLGAGNGGFAFAAHLTLLGHQVNLWNRTIEKLQPLIKDKKIHVSGELEGIAEISLVSRDLRKVCAGCQLIMVAISADGHKDLAKQIAKVIESDQIIILNPGRTGGALEFYAILKKTTPNKKVYIAEAQSLLYACRKEENNKINIFGLKKILPFAAMPAKDTNYVLSFIKNIFPQFVPVDNILQTSFENIGCIFHPPIALFNIGRIERKEEFRFYKDVTPSICSFIEQLDFERITIAKIFGIKVRGVREWILKAYDIKKKGSSLYDLMMSNPAYSNVFAPTTIFGRYFFEDVPTGLLPLREFSLLQGLKTPIMDSLITMISTVCRQDFYATGRDLKSMGVQNMTFNEINEYIQIGI